jgi:hypothetical protein
MIDDMGFSESAFNPQAGDELLLVKFFTAPRQNAAKTIEEGRPIFDDVTWVSITPPGDRTSIIERVATQMDINRFPRHYQAYKNREAQETVSGTPLSEWPGVTRSQVEELRFFNVHTIEQLIGLSDAHAGNIMGIRALQEKAKVYLESAKVAADAEKLLKSEREITDLKAQIAELREMMEGDDKPKQRGRPPKAA